MPTIPLTERKLWGPWWRIEDHLAAVSRCVLDGRIAVLSDLRVAFEVVYVRRVAGL
jgi:hypothetical protein